MNKAKEWIARQPQIEDGAPFVFASEEVVEQVQLDAAKSALRLAEKRMDELAVERNNSGVLLASMHIHKILENLTLENLK